MDALVDTLTRLNRAPSADEVQRIERFAQDEASKITALEARVTDSELLLVSLRQQLEASRQGMRAIQRFLSHIGRLPAEILAEIFMIYHSSAADPSSPLLLCQICSYWRKIAVSTPQLWKTVHIDFEKNVAGAIAGAVCRLERAGDVGPVDLQISDSKGYLSRQVASLQSPLKGIIATFSAIIGSLTLRRLPSMSLQEILGGKTFPLLCSIHLMKVGGENQRLALDSMSIQWAQLTSIHIDAVVSIWSAKKLTACVNLLDCTITVQCATYSPQHIGSPPETAHTLPNLHRLHVCFDSISDPDSEDNREFYAHFFDLFTLPALKHLHVDFADISHDLESTEHKMIELKKRSQFDLESITFESSYFALDSALAFMTKMPALSSILMRDMYACAGEDALQWAFTRGHPNQVLGLAPNLTSLVCEQSFPSSNFVDPQAVIAMAKSRSRPPDANAHTSQTCLKTLYMRGCGHYADDQEEYFEAQFEECSARGVDVEFE